MRVLVTGGAGYIGRYACEALRAAEFEPWVFDNLSTGRRPEGVSFIHGDLMNERAVREAVAIVDPGAIVHLAAASDVVESSTAPGKYRENVQGTAILANAAGKTRIVFASSAAVYGDGDKRARLETDRLDPVSFYGRTKLACEALLPDAVSLRFFNVAGGEGDLGAHLVPRALRAARSGQPLAVHHHGRQVRDFVHVEDVAQAIVAAVVTRGAKGSCNVCTGRATSVLDALSACERAARRPIPRLDAGERPGDPTHLVGDNGLAWKVLGWEPRRTLDDIARSAWEGL